jgi:hypothetical protein
LLQRSRNECFHEAFGRRSNKQKGIPLMKALLIGYATAFALVVPVLAQDTNSADPNSTNGTQQYQPGAGGTSKPGVQGNVGGKNGPAAKDPSGSAKMNPGSSASEGASTGTAGSDESHVPGDAGGKNGPAAKPTK